MGSFGGRYHYDEESNATDQWLFPNTTSILGFSPRLPGGLLSGDNGNRARPTMARLGDLSIERAMEIRKAASLAFVEADASDDMPHV